MKTVTIPTCANPFVVIINGKKYLYPAGETVEVSDEIAEVILRHEAAHAKTPGAESEDSGESESGTSGGLQVIEMDIVSFVECTTEQCAVLTAALEAGMPIIIKGSVSSDADTVVLPNGGRVFDIGIFGGYTSFVCSCLNVYIVLMTDNGLWMPQVIVGS